MLIRSSWKNSEVGYETYIEASIFPSEQVEEEVAVDLLIVSIHVYSGVEIRHVAHLRLDQDQINEQDDQIMLDILVGEALAARTLR